jgi:N-acetylneuraminic acid mutarotase
MQLINKSMKHLLLILSLASAAFLSLTLASCGGSTPTTAVKKGSWDRKSDFGGNTRGNAVGFVIQDKAYVVGGYNADGNKRLNDMWQYDAAKNSWLSKAPFPGVARSQAVSFVINGKGYVGTGIDDASNRLKDFYEYDPATNLWKKIADFADGRYGSVSFSVSNRGFIGAGYNGNAQSDLWEYDQPNDAWVQKASLSTKRVNSFSFVIDNSAYVLGGSNNSTSVRTVEKYNPASDVWELKLSLTQRDKTGATIVQPNSRDVAAAFAIDGYGYIACGSVGGTNTSGGSPLGDTWQYNPASDTWLEYYSLRNEAASRDGAVGFSIGLFGYLTTGRNGNTRFDDTWVFDPLGDEGTAVGGNGL